MIPKITKLCFFSFAALVFVTGPVAAAAVISTISAGNTVFIGEEGLDTTGIFSGPARVGWWASAASISDSSPSNIITISDPSNFYVSLRI
jgi:hypothetical protein